MIHKSLTFETKSKKKFLSNLNNLQDDTDGNIQSLPSDDEEELSFSSYTTAKAEQLSQLTSGAPHSSLVSQTSDTLVPDDQDQFHTLQDVEDLTPDTVNIPSLLSIPPDTLTQYILNYNASMPVGQEQRCKGEFLKHQFDPIPVPL